MALSVNIRNFNPSKISFVQGIAKNNRLPPINMKYGDDDKNKQPFQLILPLTNVRLLTRVDDKTGETSYTLSYTLTGCDNKGIERSDETTEIGKLYNSLLDLENVIMDTARKNNPKWFGGIKKSEDGIVESFNKIVRVSSDKINGELVANGKYPPSLWIKVPVYEGKVSIDKEGIIDNRGNPIEDVTPDNLINIFPNNTQAKLIISGRLYVIAKGGYGVSWSLRGAQVIPTSRVRAAELFAETTEDEDTREHTTVEPEMSVPSEQPQPETTSAPARKKRAAVGQ